MAGCGRVLVGETVLGETAHHAWIAENDIHEVHRWFYDPEESRQRYFRNAFARSFAAMVASRKTKLSLWSSYISCFRGEFDDDHRKVQEYVSSNFRLEAFREPTISDERVQSLIAQYEHAISARFGSNADGRHIRISKAKRDAQMVVGLQDVRARLSRITQGTRVFLATSHERLHRSTGSQDVESVSIAAALELLSFLPGARIGNQALASLLFDDLHHCKSTGIELAVVRIVGAADDFRHMPWAKRVQLAEALDRQLINVARTKAHGRAAVAAKKAELEEALQHPTPESAQEIAIIVARSLDEIGVDRKSETRYRNEM